MTAARRAGRAASLAVGLVLAAFVIAACETGAYPADLFPEMHYQQSYRTQEPPYEAPPEGQISTLGAELPVTDFVATIQLENPVPFDGPSIDRGKALFAVNCAMCHGDDGQGDSYRRGRLRELRRQAPGAPGVGQREGPGGRRALLDDHERREQHAVLAIAPHRGRALAARHLHPIA